MEQQVPAVPPKIPPKRGKRPSILASPHARQDSFLSSSDSKELSCTVGKQSETSDNQGLVRPLATVQGMVPSVVEREGTLKSSVTSSSAMTNSMSAVGSTHSADSVMTTSLTFLPSDPTSRPTPLPRTSTKHKKPPVSKRGVNQSSSTPLRNDTPIPSPKPTPRSSSSSDLKNPNTAMNKTKPTPCRTHYSLTTDQSAHNNGDELIYANTGPVISGSRHCQVPTTICQAPTSTNDVEPTYDNMENDILNAARTLDMTGFPLPPSDHMSDGQQLTPLSQESMNVLDPVQYMALWELQGPAPPSSTSEESATNCLTDSQTPPAASGQKRSVPPIPPRAPDRAVKNSAQSTSFPFAQDVSSDDSVYLRNPSITPKSTDPTQRNLAIPVTNRNEFRDSFTLSLSSDPFADTNSSDMFNMDSISAANPFPKPDPIYSLADDPDIQRLLPRKPAPAAPSKITDGDTISDLYTQISKVTEVPPSEANNPSPYSLAEDVWFDNQAASYDSEETVDEDSDENDGQPVSHPKPLTVTASPRTAPTDRHGYLFKQGGKQNNKGWKKRYVTFDGERLRYFSSEKSRISKRIIPVQVMRNVESGVKDTDSNKFKFRVLTQNRNYLFAAESLADHDYWTQILMQAIIKYKHDNGRGSMGKGMMPGGTMHTPEMKGYLRFDDNKKYVVIKNGTLCYYRNDDDFQFATPIHEVALNIASVKDVGKNKLQFSTPYHTYSMGFECDSDLQSWKISIEDGIAAALSDDNVLNEVYQNPSNRLCADCLGSRPHWVVLHLSTVVCSSCAGIHRQFWPFKVKSLRMDVKVWTEPLINLYVSVGNSQINSLWEARLAKPVDKIKPNASQPQRQSYIVKKYLRKSFFLNSIDYLPENPSQTQLDQELMRCIKDGHIINVMFLVHKGADSLQSAAYTSPVQLAESSNQPLIAQYLRLSGAEQESFGDIWAVIKSRYSDDSTKDQIIKSGYLYRMGKKEYSRQWLELTSLSLQFFDEETDEEAKLTILCRSILNLSRHENDKNEPSLEFTCKQGGITYIYGAEEKSTIDAWLAKLHKVMLMNTGQTDLGQDFTKAGHALCRRGQLGVWKWCWLLIKKRQLYILDTEGGGNEEIDLRKIHNLSLAVPEGTISAGPGEEKGPLIHLFISDRSHSTGDQSDTIYYIRSDLKQETERWFKAIDDAAKEISPNLEDQRLNKDDVPVLIEKCLSFVEIYGMRVEGIYRQAGTHSKVTNLLNDLIKDAWSVSIKAEDYTVNDVANALKRFLRNLQEPIMSSALYGKWLSASMLTQSTGNNADQDRERHEQKLYTYKSLLSELPTVNLATLKLVVSHLYRVTMYQAENKMNSINLATVFGPVLLSGSLIENPTQERFKNTTHEIKLVEDLISYYPWLFSVDKSEMDREIAIQDGIQKLVETGQSKAHAREFLFGIYVDNNMGEAINMEVAAKMTASDVVAKVAEKKCIPRTDGYSLFHIVCGGELERSLSPTEKVLNVNLSTAQWNPEHCKGSYLCVKEDQLRDWIDAVSGSDICRYAELQFSDKKTWKKMYFELNESQLICYKDKSKTKLYEWDLSDISLYVGVEKKRKPPTMYGVTFLSSDEDCTKNSHLGKSLCFSTLQDMSIWLAAIYAQSQETVSPLPSSSPSSSNLPGTQKRKRIPSLLKNPFKK